MAQVTAMVRRRLKHARKFSAFYFARFQAGFVCPRKVADLLGVTLRTVRNWDRKGCPVPVLRLLQVLNGDLGTVWPGWNGFHVNAEGIHGPGHHRISLEQLRNHHAQVELLESSLAELDRIKRWPVYRFLLRWWPGTVPGRPRKQPGKRWFKNTV